MAWKPLTLEFHFRPSKVGEVVYDLIVSPVNPVQLFVEGELTRTVAGHVDERLLVSFVGGGGSGTIPVLGLFKHLRKVDTVDDAIQRATKGLGNSSLGSKLNRLDLQVQETASNSELVQSVQKGADRAEKVAEVTGAVTQNVLTVRALANRWIADWRVDHARVEVHGCRYFVHCKDLLGFGKATKANLSGALVGVEFGDRRRPHELDRVKKLYEWDDDREIPSAWFTMEGNSGVRLLLDVIGGPELNMTIGEWLAVPLEQHPTFVQTVALWKGVSDTLDGGGSP
jgi:hypothetical protein